MILSDYIEMLIDYPQDYIVKIGDDKTNVGDIEVGRDFETCEDIVILLGE